MSMPENIDFDKQTQANNGWVTKAKAYLRMGYKPRIRKRKSGDGEVWYIVLRKTSGKNKTEVSLGRYDEERWKKLLELKDAIESEMLGEEIEKEEEEIEDEVEEKPDWMDTAEHYAHLLEKYNIGARTVKKYSKPKAVVEKVKSGSPIYTSPRDEEPSAIIEQTERLLVSQADPILRKVALNPKVIFWYEFAKSCGYEGDLGDFIVACVEDFFKSRGYKLKVVREEVV